MKRNWMQVKNRKPDENKPILLFIKMDDDFFNIVTGHYSNEFFLFFDLYMNKFRPVPMQWKVTHWTFLPKHPKQKEKKHEQIVQEINNGI